MGKRVIVWTLQAKNSLKSIYDYHKEKSPQGARNVKNDLLQSPKTISFSKPYQVDEINSKYRRIIVRALQGIGEKIEIIDIISAKQSPSKLRKI